MSEANAGGVGGLFLLRASKSPPTRLASLATLPANGREGKGQRAHQQMCAFLSASRGERADDLRRSHAFEETAHFLLQACGLIG